MTRTVPSMVGWGARSTAQAMPWRATTLLVVSMVAFAFVVGSIERAHAPLTAADRVADTVFSVALPLGSFGFVGLAAGDRRLDESLWWLARLGLSRQCLVLGSVALMMLLAALASAACAVIGLKAAYGSAPGFAPDALTCAWVAALGAAAYVSWFAFGATFLPNGRGRWVVLLLDFVAGGWGDWSRVLFPRGHVTSLGGGPAVMGLPQSSSSVVLAASAAALLLLAAYRVRQ